MNCSPWVAGLDDGHLGRAYEMGRAAPGWRVYSQSYQDGILDRVFDRFGTANKRFVEFGLGYTSSTALTDAGMDALQLNTRMLARRRGWSGVYFDALIEAPAFGVRARSSHAIPSLMRSTRQTFLQTLITSASTSTASTRGCCWACLRAVGCARA